ncbi:MAG TPA: alginate lyase family protein [Candidatus Polarisedimenticolia bacterium]|jgi:hypothetical protein|nr:alginate lyase family protein [Candidatus Polarisedimenticolia bacterium]
MGFQELASRGRQEAAKWLDRLGASVVTEDGARRRRLLAITGAFASRQPGDAVERALGRAFQWFNENAPGRFFDGAASDGTEHLLGRCLPPARLQLLAAAGTIGRKRFDLLGYRELFFGDPIDWRLDPLSGRRAPFAHWSRIDLFDSEAMGDPKVIWELNRHQWLVTLGQSYRLDGDERHAEMFASSVREWTAANPVGWGINWASSLEVALRLISWCWALHLFRGSRALTPDLLAEMRAGIRSHAAHVERYLSHYTSPNTHLTGEALGLFYAGTQLPDLAEAGRWTITGERILAEQVARQVLPDGVYFEQATCYQRYTIEIYLHFLILASRCGRRVPEAVPDRIRKALDFLLAIATPRGTVPSMGDSDGGWLLPLHRRDPNDVRGIFSTAAALFGRAEYAWAAGGLAPETLWLLGPEGEAAFRAVAPTPPRPSSHELFGAGGYVVMRSGWGPCDHQIIFDVGPLDPPSAAGHAHADLLSVQCALFGEPCVVDPGTFRYAADPLWRDMFRGTAAHSTVTVDGAGQAVPSGPFAWHAAPRARLRRFASDDSLGYADAEHGAYCRLPDPVVHRRRILFLKPRYLVIVDDLDGKAEHRIDTRFQFAPLRAEQQDGWVRATGPRRTGLLIRSFANVDLTTRIAEGSEALPEGWVSPDYGQRRPAPIMIVSAEALLPLRIITLLVPTDGKPGRPPEVSLLDRGARRPAGLILDGGRDTLRFEEEGVVVNGRSFP